MDKNKSKMGAWPLQDAKARFSELIKVCAKDGPQVVTVRGTEEAVIIAIKDYRELVNQHASFVEFMRTSPLKGLDLGGGRDKSPIRKVDL